METLLISLANFPQSGQQIEDYVQMTIQNFSLHGAANKTATLSIITKPILNICLLGLLRNGFTSANLLDKPWILT
jgi:hypothetical protein